VTTRRMTPPRGPVIPSMEATKAVNFHRKDALVVSTSSALREWSQVSERRDLDIDLSDCMDRAPAVGLGLALAQPEGKVLVLDCDSALRANLGGLATIGESNPENLVHFVFDDVSSASTSGLPIRELDNLDLAQIALSSGYAKAYEFDKLEEFLIGLEDVMRQIGPVFVRVKVFRDGEPPPFPERTMAQGWAEVRENLSAAKKERAGEPE
jgi:thiamine pyrophosphate-dependent acetolactate synthase large subunit-like protein